MKTMTDEEFNKAFERTVEDLAAHRPDLVDYFVKRSKVGDLYWDGPFHSGIRISSDSAGRKHLSSKEDPIALFIATTCEYILPISLSVTVFCVIILGLLHFM